MPVESLSVRLTRLMLAGRLTVADLAHWLNRPHSTVRLWVAGETSPSGRFQIDLMYSRVLLLEKFLRAGHTIPEMSAHKRPHYIKQARDDFSRGIVPTRDIA